MTLEEALPPRFIAEDRLSGVKQSDLLSGGLGTRGSSTTLRELLGVETTLGLDVHVEDVSVPSTSTLGVVVGVEFEEPAPESSFKLLAKLSARCVEAPDVVKKIFLLLFLSVEGKERTITNGHPR